MSDIVKLGSTIQSQKATKHLTDGEFIRGSYMIVDSIDDITSDMLDENDGVIVEGSLVYDKQTSKYYQRINHAWVIKQELTADEKSKIAEIDNKLNKVTVSDGIVRMYTVEADGRQDYRRATYSVTNNSVVLRDDNGRTKFSNPIDNDDAATKGYVDTGLSNKQNSIDNNLQTIDKTIVGAINELNDKSSGTSDYDDLSNKPQINSITLEGNKTSSDLGLLYSNDEEVIPPLPPEVEYIRDAEVSQDGNTLTLTKEDDTTVEFTPQGGGISDVQNADGTSFVTNNVATIPDATETVKGLTTLPNNYVLLKTISSEDLTGVSEVKIKKSDLGNNDYKCLLVHIRGGFSGGGTISVRAFNNPDLDEEFYRQMLTADNIPVNAGGGYRLYVEYRPENALYRTFIEYDNNPKIEYISATGHRSSGLCFENESFRGRTNKIRALWIQCSSGITFGTGNTLEIYGVKA